MTCTYLLPIRRRVFDRAEADALRFYLASIAAGVAEILVVDGSPADVFAAHHQLWAGVCRHEPVDRKFGFLNDKVNGIQTGLRLAANEKIILADDDIRYDPSLIGQVATMLDDFEVVRPQNYFAFGKLTEDGRQSARAIRPAAWWAKMEAARMLINRACLRTADYPGTCAFRRQTMLRAGDYDGDVLFDNEELIRHLARCGAHIAYANDLFVEKRPPIFRKWLEQRPRQAYEDFGLRAKTIAFAALPLAVIATGIVAGVTSMLVAAGLIMLAAVGLASLGRARGRARQFFPFQVCLFAPLWIFERTLSTYWAFYWYLRHGGYPFGDQLLQKGIGRDWVEGGRIASERVAVAGGRSDGVKT